MHSGNLRVRTEGAKRTRFVARSNLRSGDRAGRVIPVDVFIYEKARAIKSSHVEEVCKWRGKEVH